MTTHADLVQQAQHYLPGTIVREDSLADYRTRLFALIKEAYGHLPHGERIQHAYHVLERGVALEPQPYSGWCQFLADNDLPEYEKKLKENGVL